MEEAKGDSRIKVKNNADFTDMVTALSTINFDDDVGE